MKNPYVLLIAPPTDLLGMPSLGLGILKAGLVKRNIACRIIYTNRIFLDAMGIELYQDMLKGFFNNLIIECLFAPLAHEGLAVIRAEDLKGAEMPAELREYHRILGALNTDLSDQILQEGQNRCRRFVKTCAEEIIQLHPKILGFSNSFMTTNAAIAIGREVKQSLRDVLYVVGGSNCQGTMGEELAKAVSIIDYVFQGDADNDFPDFCERYISNRVLPPSKLIKCLPVLDLDTAQVPDHSDFFKQPGMAQQSAILSFESSRGCSWGQKNRCKFCGESEDLSYRLKSPERMIEELFNLRETYPDVKTFFAADAIFPETYIKDVLPRLIDGNFNRKLICETRAHLSPEQIALMKKCGIDRILVGIESLSTRILKILNKGSSALNNIRLLRDCLEIGVDVVWLLMLGIPGDRAEDYEEQFLMLPWIEHLMPPSIGLMRIQRFSPFFENPESSGITGVQPLPVYRHAFPDTMDTNRLAYYFNASYPSDARNNSILMSSLIHQVRSWQEKWRNTPAPELSVRSIDTDKWEVRDTRTCAIASSEVIDAEEYLLLKKCRQGLFLDLKPFGRLVNRLLEKNYLLRVDGRLLSLVCEAPSFDHKA